MAWAVASAIRIVRSVFCHPGACLGMPKFKKAEPKPSVPWAVRPKAPRGDDEPKELFAAIGAALTEWEQVESSLAEIFAVLVSAARKSTFWSPAIQAYGTVISVRGRCDMVRVGADAYFNTRKKKRDSFRETLSKLIIEVLEFSNRRNEIAHGQVASILALYDASPPRSLGYYLFPSLYNPKKFKFGGKASYTYMSSDVIHYRQEFTKLHLRLEGFRYELTGRKPPLTGRLP